MAATAFRDAATRAAEERLGAALRTAKVPGRERARMIVGAIFFPAFVLTFVALAVGAALAEDEAPLPIAAWAGVLVLVGLFGWLAVYAVVYAVRFARSTLALHANGLVLTTRGRPEVLLWEDITGWTRDVTHLEIGGVHARTVRVLTLTTRAGRKVRVPGAFEDAAELFARLEAALTAAKLPAALASMEAGLPVSFGPFVAARDGLAHGKRRVPWTEVGAHAVSHGILSVRTNGRPLTARYAKVPSAPVLFALLEQLRGRRHG